MNTSNGARGFLAALFVTLGLSACGTTGNLSSITSTSTNPADLAYRQFALDVEMGKIQRKKDGVLWLYADSNYQGKFSCKMWVPVETSSLVENGKRTALAFTETSACEPNS